MKRFGQWEGVIWLRRRGGVLFPESLLALFKPPVAETVRLGQVSVHQSVTTCDETWFDFRALPLTSSRRLHKHEAKARKPLPVRHPHHSAVRNKKPPRIRKANRLPRNHTLRAKNVRPKPPFGPVYIVHANDVFILHNTVVQSARFPPSGANPARRSVKKRRRVMPRPPSVSPNLIWTIKPTM